MTNIEGELAGGRRTRRKLVFKNSLFIDIFRDWDGNGRREGDVAAGNAMGEGVPSGGKNKA